MQLGVQTHFSQGWSTSLLGKLKDLGVTEIRDEQVWDQIESTAGQYNFSGKVTNYMDMAEGLGVDALLVFTSGNALYDSGKTPYSVEGRQAYANHIVAVLQKYGSQVKEIEIWNEFMRKRGWNDEATPMLKRRLAEGGFTDREDIQTFFGFIDLDEGRDPRGRG